MKIQLNLIAYKLLKLLEDMLESLEPNSTKNLKVYRYSVSISNE